MREDMAVEGGERPLNYLRPGPLLRYAVTTAILVIGAAAFTALPAPAQDAPGGGQEARAQQLFIAGMTRAYVDDHDAAVGLFQRALELKPGDAAILTALAESHSGRGDVAAALFHAEEAAAASPDEPSIFALLADLREERGDVAGAVDALRQRASLVPRSPEALTELAQMEYRAGRFGDALETYRQLIDVAGDQPGVRIRILQIYHRLEDLDGALETTRALIELDPRNPDFHEQLVQLGTALGDREVVAEALARIVELDPGNAEARLALAELYREEGDEASAEALLDDFDASAVTSGDDFTRAAGLYARSHDDPQAARQARELLERLSEAEAVRTEVLLMLGDLLFRAGDFPGAAEVLAPALEAEPIHLAAWVQLAAALLESGDAESAAEVTDDALLLFPGQYPLLRLAAIALMQQGDNEAAARHATQAIEILADEHPDALEERANLLAVLGLIQMRRGDQVRSDDLHQQSLELHPDNAMALNNFAYDLAERGERLDDALEMAERAVELDADNPSYLDTLGWVHHVRGDHAEAVRWLTRAVDEAGRRDQPRAVLYEHLGEAQAALGDHEAAIRSWNEALDLEPNRQHLRQRIEEVRSR